MTEQQHQTSELMRLIAELHIWLCVLVDIHDIDEESCSMSPTTKDGEAIADPINLAHTLDKARAIISAHAAIERAKGERQ